MTAQTSIRALAAFCLTLCVGLPAAAIEPEACTRVTHISHGGQADHADLGEGRVMWRDWWSQEGSATDMTIAQCDSGEVLRFRTQEYNMSARLEFDRTDKLMEIVAREHRAARAFATLSRIAEAIEPLARDVALSTQTAENCACAAFYPQMLGRKSAFKLAVD